MPKVALLMGSKSDYEILKPTISTLEKFSITCITRIISAHRTPEIAHDFAQNAEKEGIEVIICAAGKAAHLGGVIASFTTLPVIGVPILSSTFSGLDSLLSIVQMPAGVPVACVAVNGAENAAILAAQILALKYPQIALKLVSYREEQKNKVIADDLALSKELQSK